LQKIYFYLYRS